MKKKNVLKLREIIESGNLDFIMEAHNGLSAKIVQEAGFNGIWASGLSISASLGVRDSNEASWTQVLDVLEFMSDSVDIPILLDGDTGYGNFNNARRLVKKLEQRGIAGVCIEDKQFPKTNSLMDDSLQPLADIDEFCGKIKAMRDARSDSDFVIVARVEAFIAGWGLTEAINRASRYVDAGADAILIHSKKTEPSEIVSFMNAWNKKAPVIIVPTKYYSTPTELFKDLDISLIIWANHNLRSSITAMQSTSRIIFNDESLTGIEDGIAPVAEVFRLQGADELRDAEKNYLPSAGKDISAIILAAAQGKHLGELTKENPKSLLKIGGKTIISRQLENFNHFGIKEISIVRGFGKDKFSLPNVSFIDNDDFEETTELYSLFLAKEYIKNDTIISYGDIVFKKYILSDLLNDKRDIAIVVDSDYKLDDRYHEYVKTSIKYHQSIFLEKVSLLEVSDDMNEKVICGEFIGLIKLSNNGAYIVRNILDKLYEEKKDFKKLRMKDLINEILKEHPISVVFIKGSWLDINTLNDLQKSEDTSIDI